MKKRIVVLGLHPRQFRRVEKAMAGTCELVHAQSKKLRVGMGLHVVVMARFVSHSAQEQALSLWPRENVHLIRGCVQGAVKTIRSLL